MKCVRFDSASEFQASVLPFLLQHEAENNLMIGLAARLAAGSDIFTAPGQHPLLCAVQDQGAILAAGLMTPPFRITLTRGPREALHLIARQLHKKDTYPPGVLAPNQSAQDFAAAWRQLTSQSSRRKCALRIYQLDRVTPAPRTPGTLAVATQSDFDLALTWMQGFCRDVNEQQSGLADRLRHRIDEQQLYFWKTPHPVSMAGSAGPTPNGIRVSAVYTPPDLRRRGYASALVAALSQRLLDASRKFCFLFTDLANPTSNSIYQKIGYQPVCDFEELDFGPTP